MAEQLSGKARVDESFWDETPPRQQQHAHSTTKNHHRRAIADDKLAYADEGDDESDSASSELPSDQIPQILTYDAVAPLVDHLDASDVLECYLLTRHTYLHYTLGGDQVWDASTNTTKKSKKYKIPIQTSALALRYRPNPIGIAEGKKPLSLTLEFGPSRAGKDNKELAVPQIRLSSDPLDEGDPTQIHWSNQGQVYYTTTIAKDDYSTANYMASLTGAVLGDLLKMVDAYPNTPHSHRRYQPWQIVDFATPEKILFRSNGDYDFVHAVLEHLASVGVELSPVLNPTVSKVQLSAVEIKRHAFTPDSYEGIVAFYDKLYTCLDSLATAKQTTLPPTYSPTSAPSFEKSATTGTTEKPTTEGNGRRKKRRLDDNSALTDATSSIDEETITTSLEESPISGPITTQHESQFPSPAPSYHPTQAPVPTLSPFPSISPTTIPPVSSSSAAGEAAHAAQEAAKIANQTSNAEEAAQAAQQAASAAQKAADVTNNQQAKLRQEALLSGGAYAMAQTASLCLSDPVYGIAEKANSNSTTVYLYWDSTFYYTVQVKAPYINVLQMPATLPQPPPLPTVPGDLFVDWCIFLVLVGFFLLFLVILLQQVLGRNFRIIKPLYKCQRWFFDPTRYHYDDLQDTDEAKKFGGGQPYSFGQDSIPSSMGGKRTYLECTILRKGSNDSASQYSDHVPQHRGSLASSDGADWVDPIDGGGAPDESLGDVELTAKSPARSRNSSWTSGRPGEDDFDLLPLFRDPEHVEMPDLTSQTPVAVPVSLRGDSIRNASN